MATSTPARAASAISLAIRITTSGSIPNLPPPTTSPDNLRTTRVSTMSPAAAPVPCVTSCLLDADFDVCEPRDVDSGFVDHHLDRLLVVGHRRLIQKRDLLEVAVQSALYDLGHRFIGF